MVLVRMCSSAVSVLLFVLVSLFNVLWIVLVMSEVLKKGATVRHWDGTDVFLSRSIINSVPSPALQADSTAVGTKPCVSSSLEVYGKGIREEGGVGGKEAVQTFNIIFQWQYF
jgi:hypothetical protein